MSGHFTAAEIHQSLPLLSCSWFIEFAHTLQLSLKVKVYLLDNQEACLSSVNSNLWNPSQSIQLGTDRAMAAWRAEGSGYWSFR